MKPYRDRSPQRLGIVRRIRRAKLFSLVIGYILLTGDTMLSGPVVYAADDQPVVSITPRRANQVKPGSNALRLDVNLVLIPVLVTDLYDRPVRGLNKENFRLSEGGAEQTITQFFSQETPISIGLVFDASNSMRTKIDQTRLAVSEFLRMSTSGDEFFLLKFGDAPESVCGFTTNVGKIEKGVASIRTGGWTLLFDAIYLGVHQMKQASHTRKVLLVLSDGGDNNSRYTENEIKQLVKEADVRIFSISILTGAPSLEKISEESGGRAIRVRNLDGLPDMASTLSEEIHSEYVLGYSPSDNQSDGKYRTVKVELLQPAGGPRPRRTPKTGHLWTPENRPTE
jgi:VWFA-related protein